MAEDYYTDSPDAAAAPAAEPEEEKGGSTALLPKNFFQGKELTPGNRCEVEIKQVYDDQVSVSYVAHEETEEAAPDVPVADEEMAGMLA